MFIYANYKKFEFRVPDLFADASLSLDTHH